MFRPLRALAALAAIALLYTSPGSRSAAAVAPPDREAARFARCSGPVRITCVVDGDTFWYRGTKIRVADVNAPEVSAPRCAAEARLGERATRRLTALLNAGRFTLQPSDRASDAYGRRLFTVTRAGASLGARLAAEGLARPWTERWRGGRPGWC